MRPTALHFVVLTVAGWMNRRQADAIAYLREENRVLREHVGPRRLRFTDAQRRRLATRAKRVGVRRLKPLATIVTPKTLLRCYAMRRRHAARVRPPPAPGTRLLNAPGPGIVRESVRAHGRLADDDRAELRAHLRAAARTVTPADDTLAARLEENDADTVDCAAQPHPMRDDPATHGRRRTVLRGRGRRRGRQLPAEPDAVADDNPLADVATPETPSTHPLLQLELVPPILSPVRVS